MCVCLAQLSGGICGYDGGQGGRSDIYNQSKFEAWRGGRRVGQRASGMFELEFAASFIVSYVAVCGKARFLVSSLKSFDESDIVRGKRVLELGSGTGERVLAWRPVCVFRNCGVCCRRGGY